MKKRKVLALAMATTMMVSSLAGCGSTSSGSAGTAATEGSTTESTNSYTMFIRSQYHDWIKELKWYDVAEETTGITVEYVDGPEEISDTYTEVDQRIASGTLPDATMCKLSQAKVYGSQGAFVDLAPYIKKYAPNYHCLLYTSPSPRDS